MQFNFQWALNQVVLASTEKCEFVSIWADTVHFHKARAKGPRLHWRCAAAPQSLRSRLVDHLEDPPPAPMTIMAGHFLSLTCIPINSGQ